MTQDDRIKALIWRSYRGNKELDEMLVPFAQNLHTLSEDKVLLYHDLLEIDNNHDLMDWILFGKKAPDHYQSIVDCIRSNWTTS